MQKGRARGFEPPNGGATSRCLNHLATPAVETRIYQCLVTGLFPRPSLPLVLLAAAAALLGVSNPGPNDFADFAGEQLSELGVKEVCREGVLPLMLQLVVQDCPRLFRDQREALGDLARNLSVRQNFGLFSIYRTEVGGAGLLAELPIPGYRLDTLALAGQFIVLRAEPLR